MPKKRKTAPNLAEIYPPKPPVGWTTLGTVVKHHDGDTSRVRVCREIDVRLLDCWVPDGTDLDIEANRLLNRMCPVDSRVTIFIPASEDDQLRDIFTFGRCTGYVYDTLGRNMSEEIVRRNFGTPQKHGG